MAAGGRSTNVMIAASRPRFSTSRSPSCRELNCPRLGSRFTRTKAPLEYATGARLASLFPATITTKSVAADKERIADDRKVPLEADCSEAGGQGSKALSRPMREDSPAARITPAKLGARDMLGNIAESVDECQCLESAFGCSVVTDFSGSASA